MKLILSILSLTLLSTLLPLQAAGPLAHADFEIDEDVLATLAVQDQGRKKPMTTLTSEALMTIYGNSVYYPEGKPKWWQRMTRDIPPENKAIPANRVMLDMWMRADEWQDRPVIYLGHRLLKEELGLDPTREHFSLNELNALPRLGQLVREAQMKRMANERAELEPLQEKATSLNNKMASLSRWLSGEAVAIVPHPTSQTGKWASVQAVTQLYPPSVGEPVFEQAATMRQAYLAGDEAGFHDKLGKLAGTLRQLSPEVYPSAGLMASEKFYQDFHPFRWAWICFLLALISLAVTTRWHEKGGYRLAWALVLAGFGLQVTGFVYRVMISGRPPVTNMYETVIWVAFGVVLFAMILEAVYRCRYFLLAACPAAVLSLILADMQPTVLDPAIHPLVPVLRHNTWLIIHVLTIVSSYAAFLLALALAHIYLVKDGWFAGGKQGRKELNLLHQYVYRAIQIGVLLLAVGTILGGVWANYSWGRFWGWDPKETWALAALLCYLAVLHGRLAGWWGGYGLAIGSVLCFQAIVMAWYGVNFILGKGLHSYGFGTGGQEYAAGFVIAEVVFLGICIWRHQTKPKDGGGKTKPKKESASVSA